MVAARKANTTARGLGWPHQRDVAKLFRDLRNGDLCWWCALPMFAEIISNWDRRKLRGDHSVPRSIGGAKADRLLHATCNEQRQAGRFDHERPAVLGIHPSEWAKRHRTPEPEACTGTAMDW